MNTEILSLPIRVKPSEDLENGIKKDYLYNIFTILLCNSRYIVLSVSSFIGQHVKYTKET